MRKSRRAALGSATSQMDTVQCGAMRGGRKIQSDGENEVSPAKTGEWKPGSAGSEHGRTAVLCFIQ
jgi:hypothetical protein